MEPKRALQDQATIRVWVGRVVNQYRMNPYFVFAIREGPFSYQFNEIHLQKAKALDGL
ncbi:MAG: hypothetical protein OXE77_02905 [Flavobacteriaceae bacterium]|nr:hypothetical protein [Flavobacteriaceae bacterium]MCY4266702.1 hypothetical protein [Flavobacteriaceae bacterium]MCY4298951.1 hypothetical protein [Flavobacteriaceae bacterium]